MPPRGRGRRPRWAASVTPVGTPLGELWVGGLRVPSVAFHPPSGPGRSCVAIGGRRVRSTAVRACPPPPGATSSGRAAARAPWARRRARRRRPRGLLGRPRAVRLGHLRRPPPRAPPWASRGATCSRVVCDGRAPGEAGLTLGELASLMAGLGARRALNLDGGARPRWSSAGGCATRRARGRGDRDPRRPAYRDRARVRAARRRVTGTPTSS